LSQSEARVVGLQTQQSSCFRRTIQEEFYATAFRKKLFTNLEELQAGFG